MTAIYPGSFDPFTNGHLNILRHASKIFDSVHVVVMSHPNKKRLIDPLTSALLIYQSTLDEFSNIDIVVADSNLIYKEAARLNCDYIIRGVRNNGLDYSYEENLAEFNKTVGNLDTIFIRADVNKHVSSTMIRTLLSEKEDISKYVPKEITEYFEMRSDT